MMRYTYPIVFAVICAALLILARAGAAPAAPQAGWQFAELRCAIDPVGVSVICPETAIQLNEEMKGAGDNYPAAFQRVAAKMPGSGTTPAARMASAGWEPIGGSIDPLAGPNEAFSHIAIYYFRKQ